MKSLSKTALLLSFVFVVAVNAPAQAGDEEEAILEVIQNSYVKAIHAKFDEAAIMAGFHPSFIMFAKRDSELSHVTIADWVGRMKKSADPNAAPRNVRFTPTAVNVTGDAASVRIELYRDDKLVFTDFFLLYKIDGGWKIVGKAYHRH